ncbi:hypothetical protein EXT65_21115 [Pectobacterium carotovorum subsp. carotovorum]|nr:hypothetical protein [Pectobacterium carotovorum]MCL6336296.1 hypothetical protein [Pectobacterium carotovorum subsp. carotovorum]
MRQGVAIIKVNDIEVGSMPLAQYDEIVKDVKKDWRIWAAMLISNAGFVWRVVNKLWHNFVQAVMVVVSTLLVYFFLNPAEGTLFITELRIASPDTIMTALRNTTVLCIAVTIIINIVWMLVRGHTYVSPSEIAINKKIREVMEVPAEGPVTITLNLDELHSAR